MSKVWAFERDLQVRFSHCDPAGIIFFPQYLVMFVDLVDDWFTNRLGVSYADMIMKSRVGVPTVKLDCDFTAISRLGDHVTLGLSVTRVGGSSFTLDLGCRAGAELRCKLMQVLVTTSLETHKPIAIPTHIKSAMLAFQQQQQPQQPSGRAEGDAE